MQVRPIEVIAALAREAHIRAHSRLLCLFYSISRWRECLQRMHKSSDTGRDLTNSSIEYGFVRL